VPDPRKVDKALLRINQKAGLVRSVLTTDAGREMMTLLEEAFYHGEIFGETAEKTAYNLGRRDVVLYLRQLRDFKHKEDVDVFG
jgi:hypothetical protein